MLPADGVYVCRARFSDESYGAVTNVGVRPTFAGTRRTVEAYLLDFAGDLYGELLRIEFLHRLRGEQKFDGISALVAQITADVGAARSWLKSHQGEKGV
jgi:riboflavin kinase/FMN adenylyltransferase